MAKKQKTAEAKQKREEDKQTMWRAGGFDPSIKSCRGLSIEAFRDNTKKYIDY
jgi:hypothetical protein